MGREIRFRSWDKERKEMRQVQLMDWSDWWVSTGHTWERENGLEYGERNSFKNEETDRHVLMQYTGLKDRNGKEIYEGDIVKQTFHAEARDSNGEWIAFDGFHIGAVTISPSKGVVMKNPRRWSEETDEITVSNQHKSVTGRRAEVIGNIYEHPHLLEAK